MLASSCSSKRLSEDEAVTDVATDVAVAAAAATPAPLTSPPTPMRRDMMRGRQNANAGVYCFLFSEFIFVPRFVPFLVLDQGTHGVD
jgi:hypothetical protein